MAREIKFRAWDQETDLMKRVFGFDDNWVRCWNWDDLDDGPYQDDDTNSVQRKNAVLMQFTGLKDKNGRKIYEGDIVRSAPTPDLSVPFIIAKVVWEQDVFSDGDPAFKMFHQQSGHTTSFKQMKNREPFEVIGNIYENPELLKKSA
jgi:uncharacterized phage protein (TIGR01671 family)